mmetsp:Transcript_18890/g.27993  ORF Transcript_18890/g.27993 Transcript_18890/m.27993 type:complete len:328 (-) Transcript_18890:113-1096(-)
MKIIPAAFVQQPWLSTGIPSVADATSSSSTRSSTSTTSMRRQGGARRCSSSSNSNKNNNTNKKSSSFSRSSSSSLSFSFLADEDQQQQWQQSFQSVSSLLTSSSTAGEQTDTMITNMVTITAPTAAGVTEAKTFEAVAPDTTILIGFGIVFVLSLIASYVWSEQVVPISRTKLALSKRNGEVKNYLDGLKQVQEQEQGSDINTRIDGANADAEDANENAISTRTAEDGVSVANSASVSDSSYIEIKPNVGDGRDLERWLFSDWLNNNKSTGGGGGGGRKKEPALPFLKKAKWNSGDNPVVVTAAIMMVGIVIASVTERVGTGASGLY